MFFNSALFLFCFLPLALFVYYVLFRNVSTKPKNFLLLIISLVWFFMVDPILTGLLFVLTTFNIAFVRQLLAAKSKLLLLAGVLMNGIALLAYTLLPGLMKPLGITMPYVAIPLVGILYFCHSLQLLLLSYRDDKAMHTAASSMALYLLFFPVYTAGPILSFPEFSKQAKDRSGGMADVSAGAKDFVIGLAKVIVLGQVLSFAPRTAFEALPNISARFGLMALVLYLFQIYFEISGFCQMAKGTARMFGFCLPASVDRPLLADTITGHFSRFPISVQRFINDVIMPRRKGGKKAAILGVFFFSILMSSFFGQSFGTLLFGLILFFMLLAEQWVISAFTVGNNRIANYLIHLVGFLPFLFLAAICLGSRDVPQLITFLKLLFGFGQGSENVTSGSMFMREYGPYYLAAAMAILPIGGILTKWRDRTPRLFAFLETVFLLALLVLCTLYLSGGDYLPFFAR